MARTNMGCLRIDSAVKREKKTSNKNKKKKKKNKKKRHC